MPQVAQGKLGQLEKFGNGEIGSLLVGHVVALDKDQPGKVVRAHASDLTKMPAIGFVARIRGDLVFVQASGLLPVAEEILAPDSEIEMNALYWVHPATAGLITKVRPMAEDFPGGGLIQSVALGRDVPRTLHVFVERMGVEV